MPVISQCDDPAEWISIATPGAVPIPLSANMTDYVTAPASIQAALESGYWWLYLYKDFVGEDWSSYPILSINTKVSSLTNKVAATLITGNWIESTYDLSFAQDLWQKHQIDLNSPTAGNIPDLTNVIRFRMDYYAAENPIAILLDQVEIETAIPPEEPPAFPLIQVVTAIAGFSPLILPLGVVATQELRKLGMIA